MQNGYTKYETNAAKGVAVILLLIHHLFYLEQVFLQYDISTFVISLFSLYSIARWSKICVYIFVFLSAYGMSKSYERTVLGTEAKLHSAAKFSVLRYLQMMWGFWFVYVLAFLLSIVTKQPIFELYGSGVQGILSVVADFTGFAYIFGTPKLNETWWYFSLAAFLVFAFPFLYRWCEKAGIAGVVCSVFISVKFINDYELMCAFPTAMCGICVAQSNCFEIWGSKVKKMPARYTLALTGIFFVLAKVWLSTAQKSALIQFRPVFAPLLSAIIVFLVYVIFKPNGIIKKCLAFLGVHSANIFMTHTFFSAIYPVAARFVYGFKYAILILLALMLCSLFTSIVVQTLKRIIRYDQLLVLTKRKFENT